jgi:hypothetical protein
MDRIKKLFSKKENKQCAIFGVSNSCSKPDEYKAIMARNIMVAQGYECSKCKVIRAYNMPICNCC